MARILRFERCEVFVNIMVEFINRFLEHPRYTGSKFSDADPNPVCLFESWGYEPPWDDLKNQYAGTTVPMSDLEKFVIERTDYLPVHARKILAQCEESGQITVDAMPNCKRRGKTFPGDKVRITFPS
jgi:hypothetical protein